MSRGPAGLLRADKKFWIVLGSCDLVALDLGGRSRLFRFDAADAAAAARLPGDPIARLQWFRHRESSEEKLSPNSPDAIRLQRESDGVIGFTLLHPQRLMMHRAVALLKNVVVLHIGGSLQDQMLQGLDPRASL